MTSMKVILVSIFEIFLKVCVEIREVSRKQKPSYYTSAGFQAFSIIGRGI